MRAARAQTRARRLKAPLLLALFALLGLETAGGIVIFFARTAFGSLPGVTLHVGAGLALIPAYLVYQWRHLARVWPVRGRLDYVLGLIATAFFAFTLATGAALTWPWWRSRGALPASGYPLATMALHIIGCMIVVTFVAAHLGAVLQRDRAGR